MKFLFLTAALVHCALASGDSSGSDSPRLRDADTQACGNEVARKNLRKQLAKDEKKRWEKEGHTYRQETTSDSPPGLAEEEKDTELTLVAFDHTANRYVESEDFTIRKGLVYNMSVMVQKILEGDKDTTRIYCKEVDAETLNYICEYLRMVNGRKPKEITKPIRTKDIVQCVHEDDRADGEWIEGIYTNPEVDGKEVVFDIMLAANSMAIQPLLHLGACKIATLIKGQSPEAIKEILGGDAAAGHRRRRLQNLFGSF
jgi:S-phase kinase-associated protein 1